MTLEDLYDMIREQQKLLEKILKLLEDREKEVSDELWCICEYETLR